jgi:hypothetical protein
MMCPGGGATAIEVPVHQTVAITFFTQITPPVASKPPGLCAKSLLMVSNCEVD